MSSNNSNQDNFIRFALEAKVLSFGEFKTKAGRLSPYFFNAGEFNDGARLSALGRYYAKALQESGIQFDMLYGPAYKGITLAAATAIALADDGINVPYAYNRKEAKDHGEGGMLVGAPVKGRVVIIDDVISAGTSVRESVDLIRKAGAEPAAVLIALDRMERSGNAVEIGDKSAVQAVEQEFGLPVVTIANLAGLMSFLTTSSDAQLTHYLPAVKAYRDKYGI
ncbi:MULTISPECIES: orotate phosphoribosyltransferase [unclassified Polynucleobacter]|uniref:orotate phosphoribosyltransferase n=1 Tax=unclassified Polynucleobacter TaxID=2640945 RepID=UPI001BFEA2E3|nr:MULTISPECIES: orotate phosphoribosyltransferase [unclassified Polynucleobacter]MEA9603034.1 orotate phosphoribosyltransferase [Polynucleobacter sp. JS-JIR-II-c23]QWE02470.1 orotate phosphoribosyltransferase [Polynucleobacter sp. JS-JIR-II-b4]